MTLKGYYADLLCHSLKVITIMEKRATTDVSVHFLLRTSDQHLEQSRLQNS